MLDSSQTRLDFGKIGRTGEIPTGILFTGIRQRRVNVAGFHFTLLVFFCTSQMLKNIFRKIIFFFVENDFVENILQQKRFGKLFLYNFYTIPLTWGETHVMVGSTPYERGCVEFV
jgi:hypothetical protein